MRAWARGNGEKAAGAGQRGGQADAAARKRCAGDKVAGEVRCERRDRLLALIDKGETAAEAGWLAHARAERTAETGQGSSMRRR
jgi:hypothetical protein